MSIPFDEAVSTIEMIFNGKVEREVIVAVLESNMGHMEKTIECLLQMNGEIPESEVSKVDIEEQQKKIKQIKEDEMLARMLQNQMFVSELQQYPEFSSIFQNSEKKTKTNISNATPTRITPTSINNTSNNTFVQNEPDFTDKLKQLGDAAKLKFKELALKFKNRNNDKPNIKYSAINNEEDEDDTEIIAFDSSLSKRTAISNFEEEEEPLQKKKSSTISSNNSKNEKDYFKHKKDD